MATRLVQRNASWAPRCPVGRKQCRPCRRQWCCTTRYSGDELPCRLLPPACSSDANSCYDIIGGGCVLGAKASSLSQFVVHCQQQQHPSSFDSTHVKASARSLVSIEHHPNFQFQLNYVRSLVAESSRNASGSKALDQGLRRFITGGGRSQHKGGLLKDEITETLRGALRLENDSL